MNNILIICAAIVIVAVACVAVATILIDSSQHALQRFCLNINDGNLIGSFSLNSNDKTMEWYVQHTPLALPLGIITSIHIKGPIPTGSMNGPLTTSLCGIPSTLVCDSSIPGELSGLIDQTNPGEISLRETIRKMRKSIWGYYIEFGDGVNTIRAPLNMICGTP